MKNNFYPLLISILVAAISHAQTFSSGFIGGCNFARVHEVGLNFNKFGFGIGGKVETELSERISLEFQILYNQKGYNYLRDSLNIRIHILRFNYAEIPLLVNYHFKNRNILFCAGFSYARMTSYSERILSASIIPHGIPHKNDFLINFFFNLPFSEKTGMLIGYSHGINEVRDTERNTMISCKLYLDIKTSK